MPTISQLASDTVPNDNDLLVTVDVSAGTTKNITREDFFTGAPLPAGTVDAQAIVDSGWITLTVLSPFSAPSSSAPLQIRKLANIVYVRGFVTRTTGFSASSTPLANIPAGYRPTNQHTFALSTAGNTTIHSLQASGANDQISVRQTAADTTWFIVGGSWVADR